VSQAPAEILPCQDNGSSRPSRLWLVSGGTSLTWATAPRLDRVELAFLLNPSYAISGNPARTGDLLRELLRGYRRCGSSSLEPGAGAPARV